MKQVTIEKTAEGFAVMMEGKNIKTPYGAKLTLPTEKLGLAIAAEWQAQGNKINKHTMPLTQIACIAIDFATMKREALCNDILSYGETDVVCYRSDILELLAAQQTGLDPLIFWAEKTFGITLHVTDGIMPVKQPEENIQKFLAILSHYNSWKLAALATTVKPLSSLVLALALVEQKIDAEEAFRLSHLEETYQTEKWGTDEEKEQKINARRQDADAAAIFVNLLAS